MGGKWKIKQCSVRPETTATTVKVLATTASFDIFNSKPNSSHGKPMPVYEINSIQTIITVTVKKSAATISTFFDYVSQIFDSLVNRATREF